jgi:AAA+ superfamily predicted ATPase
LAEFLATQVFGAWDIVLHHDLARGLRPAAGNAPKRLQAMVQAVSMSLGEPGAWPRDPEALLGALDRLIERNLLEDDPTRRKNIALLFDYAQYLVPAGDLGALSRGQGTNLVRFLSWAQNPYIKRVNVAFCLIADKVAEINDRLVQSPHVSTVAVPLPEKAERERFCLWADRAGRSQAELGKERAELTPKQLAEMSNGLSLTNLQVLLAQGKQTGRPVDAGRFKQLKKSMIERQCQGLVEFIEPKHTLELVVGQQAAKERLKQDADLIVAGRLDSAPMGYLLCGPVGTGKTFLAECYAGSIGIPCVSLRNFRSKYVGETEGNLEQVLTVLRSLGPVVVVIDEADAALGTRQAEGDSGTSSRVFAMIAAQMGDTRYRGQIIWMLLTSRPDLLPIDLKRQGRCEVHIPLFYPQDQSETHEMFRVMARKNHVVLPANGLPSLPADRRWSGSDIESIVIAARRRALSSQRDQPNQEDLTTAAAEFIPSAQGLEREIQEMCAVLECTQLAFLPQEWQAKVAHPDGREQLQERIGAFRKMVQD